MVRCRSLFRQNSHGRYQISGELSINGSKRTVKDGLELNLGGKLENAMAVVTRDIL